MGNPQQPCGQQLHCWFLSSQVATAASSVTATELAMVVLWRRLQSLLRTRQLPTVTQELQICLLSQLDPLQGLLALLLQLESVGATHYLDLELVELLVLIMVDLELVQV